MKRMIYGLIFGAMQNFQLRKHIMQYQVPLKPIQCSIGYGTVSVNQSIRFFFWLLHDKLNTRNQLRRKNMELDSYSCDNCILQREETLYHLFLRCSFAQICRGSIGILPPRIRCPQSIPNERLKL
jgi:hypothetical protein